MAILVDAQNCAKTRKNVGMPSCLADLKDYIGFIAVPKGWNLDVTEDFNLAYVTEQIQKGVFIPFLRSVEFTDNTEDPSLKTYNSGLSSVIRNGYPTYSFEFSKQYAFHKAAYTYNSNGVYDLLFIDSAGSIFLATNVAGDKVTGFSGGMLNTQTFKPNDGGSEVEKTLISMQLTNQLQYNSLGAILTPDLLGFDAQSEINAIIDLNLVAEAPAAGDPLIVDVVATANPAFWIEGLDADNFRLFVNGSAVAITTATFTATNKYSIVPDTAFVATDEIYIEMYDATNSVATANADGLLYKGVSNVVEATA